MTVNVSTFLTILITASILTGCGGENDPLAPPRIYYGEDVCILCSMIISDERYAAAINAELDDGRFVSRLFDDVGDMLEYMVAHDKERTLATFVHDHDSHEWIDATTATYLHSPMLHTPMASGVGAFATTLGADTAQTTFGGPILNWTELKAVHADGKLLLPQVRQGG